MFTSQFCKKNGTVTCFSSAVSGSDLMFTAVHASDARVMATRHG